MNRLQFEDSMSHIFFDCDLDQDGVLNLIEFTEFLKVAESAFDSTMKKEKFLKAMNMDKTSKIIIAEEQMISLEEILERSENIVKLIDDDCLNETEYYSLSTLNPLMVYPGFIPPVQLIQD